MRKLLEETSTQDIYWDESNNIVWGELKFDVQTLETAIENIDAQERIRVLLGKKMTRVLIDMREMKSMNREAREYFANERTCAIQRATALLVKSKLTKVMANFFMGLNKPITPTRMFTNPEEAVVWLTAFSDD
jgi:23S rRNA U2552 (ribose-2'-O)-methylase RlmE/FtsJ